MDLGAAGHPELDVRGQVHRVLGDGARSRRWDFLKVEHPDSSNRTGARRISFFISGFLSA
jgi:hypothetical protein